jgi:hypothetical protein
MDWYVYQSLESLLSPSEEQTKRLLSLP